MSGEILSSGHHLRGIREQVTEVRERNPLLDRPSSCFKRYAPAVFDGPPFDVPSGVPSKSF
jgi:hypothetical protein